MNIQINKMTMEHFLEINNVFEEMFDCFWNKNILKSEIENKLSTYIVASYENKVVGFAGFLKVFDECDITNIVTRKDMRGKNIGSIMLNQLINIAKKKNIKRINLEVNEKNIIAQKLYKKYNFIKIGIRKKYYNNIDDAIIMQLDI